MRATADIVVLMSSAWDFTIDAGQYRVRVVPDGSGYRAELISSGIGRIMEPHGNSPTEALITLSRELYDTESVHERQLAHDIVRQAALPIKLRSSDRSKSTGRAQGQAARKANDEIYDLVNNKYFQSIPNDRLFSIVKRAGFKFDPDEEEFILVGRDGKATWQLHDATGRQVNHMLVLQWHKMDTTGRYEVVAYIS